MGLGTPPITNFTGGEWSPKLPGRVDLARYSQACHSLKNMTIWPHGGVTRRMGTEFVALAAPGASEYIRLIDFVFSEEQAYVLEFTPGLMRFFRDGGLILGQDIETLYTAADISALSYCQSADVMYLACAGRPVARLSRTGPDEFGLTDVPFTSKPAAWTGENWPVAVTLHQQRMWLGGPPLQPQRAWASKTGNLEDFTTGTAEDAALDINLVSERVNAIRWFLPFDLLLCGTAGGEWKIKGAGTEESAITVKTVLASPNSNYGTSNIKPILVGSTPLHVSSDRKRLRSLEYTVQYNKYQSLDISLLAEHLTRPGIRSLAYCKDPDSIIWCVTDDGKFCGLTFWDSEEIAGWHRHETRGEVLSVCCVPGDGFTETWFVVRRANGIFIERMKAPWDGESSNEAGCWYVDSGLLYEGEPVTSLSGLEHLEGETVAVLADGAAHAERVVSFGRIELEAPASRVIVGLPYEWELSPMRLEGLSERGTMQGKKTKIMSVTARVYKTLGLEWRLADSANSYPAYNRAVEMQMDKAPEVFTGDLELAMPGGWTRDPRVVLRGTGALPASVLMLVPKAVTNE